MKEYPIERLVNVCLSLKQLKKLSNFATAKVGKDVRVLTNENNNCYSMNDYWNGLIIQLGRKFYEDTFNDHDKVPVTEVKEKYKRIATIMYGAYYHEMFHLLYTPFGLCSTLTRSCNQYFQNFVHQVSNILEDITIEGTGMNRYPFSEPYVLSIRECFKQPEQMKMLEEAITNEPENPGTLLAYLLHFCRETDLSSLPAYKLWNDNKEFIEWGAYKCINTIDATTRAKRQVAYALQLTKILDMQEPSKDEVENPDLSDIENQSSGFNKSSSGKGSAAIGNVMNKLGDTDERSLGSNTEPQDTDEDAKQPEQLKEVKAGRSDDGSQGECPTNADLTKAGVTQLANDEPVSRYSHYADKLSKYYKSEKHMPDYLKVVREYETQIRQVVATIRKMQATNNASWNHYKMKGKLDSSTFYKKDNYKIFKKKNAPAPQADLVFEILVDNSGSMHGTKARLAGKALIIFCEALDRLHIPFSVDAFTEARSAITISLKDYDETYAKTKSNMTLFTEQFDVNKLNTWSGNIDELNLRYVADELSQRREKDKMLIVISDGATCGDWRTLKQVSNNIENSGITVLGIGIFDENVKDIYSKHMIVKNTEDLQGLGAFLNKYLIGKIFNK